MGDAPAAIEVYIAPSTEPPPCLAALYESWSIPAVVMLVVPLGVFGAVLATMLRGLDNDVFFQVGLLTTVGLSAKNAILIVEFAKEDYDRGVGLIEATLQAARHLILRTHWVMVVMDQFTRRIIGFAVRAGALDGAAICRMFNHAIAEALTLPRHLSSDHDPLFEFHRWKANLRILDVTVIKTVPEVPLSHPFIERLVGTIQRELLDQIPFWSAGDLERKLLHFRDYYNRDRVHASLGGVTPEAKATSTDRRLLDLRKYRWQYHCRGLYQLPAAA